MASAAARNRRLFMFTCTRAGTPEVRGAAHRGTSTRPVDPRHGPLTVGRSYGPSVAPAGRDERAWVRGAQRGSASDLEALFDAHWPAAHRAAYLVVHDAALAEDIAQEASSPRSAISTASTGAGRSAPGSTGSS